MISDEAIDRDAAQYALGEIRKYEAVYGRHFVSPGGEATARECIRGLGLSSGEWVLDIGCGLGGSAFLMAREHGARVHGIDVSRNMIALARERCEAEGLAESVTFELADVLTLDGSDVFDAGYSRDVFLHVADKARLFSVLQRVLKPGARLVFTDYCRDAHATSAEFRDYAAARGYALATLEEYREHLARAGFESPRAEDWTARFVDIHERELAALENAALDAAERDALARAWREKIARARRGEQRWGFFAARKPQP